MLFRSDQVLLDHEPPTEEARAEDSFTWPILPHLREEGESLCLQLCSSGKVLQPPQRVTPETLYCWINVPSRQHVQSLAHQQSARHRLCGSQQELVSPTDSLARIRDGAECASGTKALHQWRQVMVRK